MPPNLKHYREQARNQIDSQHAVLADLQEVLANLQFATDPKVRIALEALQQAFGKIDDPSDQFPAMARQFDLIQHVAHCTDMLAIAALQRRPRTRTGQDLQGLDELMASCYEPVRAAGNRFRLTFQPEQILVIFFQDAYLSRPTEPVPYITLPNFTQTTSRATGKPMTWMGIGHEVGHHVFRQLLGFRDEVTLAIQETLSNQPPAQQRLWISYAEEAFADCYAILTLGRAFLYTHHPIILYAGSGHAATAAANEDEYIHEALFECGDATHATPELRSQLGIYAYQRLIGSNQLPDELEDWLNNVIGAFSDPFYDDVLSPRGKLYDPANGHTLVQGDIFNPNPDKKLARHETITAMKMAVDAIALHHFVSLGNTCLKDLVDLASEEQQRTAGGGGKVPDRIAVPAQVLAAVAP
jgi:hypothetical protein